MNSVSYYIFFCFTYLIWLLPNKLRYLLSDLLFFLIYRIFAYRKSVVLDNLSNSFPEKSEAQRQEIAADFFRNLVDIIVETSIQIHYSKEEAMKQYRIVNPELLEPFYRENRSIVYASSHFGNWEINASQENWTPYQLLAVYKPLTSKTTERFMNTMRSHIGGIPVKMRDVFREVIKRSANGELFAVGLLADQAPMPDESHFWTLFLGQETSFFMGIEKMAKKYNMPVIFPKTKRIERGRYETEFVLLCADPKNEPEFAITKRYTCMLEEAIKQNPSCWLWSHRRWKRKRDERDPLQ